MDTTRDTLRIMRAQYFDLLVCKAEAAGGEDLAGHLDRIEKLLETSVDDADVLVDTLVNEEARRLLLPVLPQACTHCGHPIEYGSGGSVKALISDVSVISEAIESGLVPCNTNRKRGAVQDPEHVDCWVTSAGEHLKAQPQLQHAGHGARP